MAYKLQLKRGASGSLPTGSAGEPLFTTDTNDLYIGTGGANQRFQKYIASGTSAQFLKGDGSLDSNTYYLASNPSAYIALTALTASAPLSYNNTTGAFTISQASGSTNGYLSSTDWTTFNNKQNALTNPVTGTGTTNYLPKWTSGSALGNSVIYEASGSIGVGTTTITSGIPLTINAPTGSNTNIAFQQNSTDKWYLRNLTSTDDFSFYSVVGAAERLRLTSTGNLLVNSIVDNGNRLQVTGNGYFSGSLGVGTSTPAGKLTVADSVNNGTANVLYLSNTSQTGVTSAAINFINIDGAIKSSIIGAVYGNDYMTFNVGSNTERMRISAFGNLGLGVVPSAWSSSFYNVIEGGDANNQSALAFRTDTNGIELFSNAYFNGTNNIYKYTSAASLYQNTNGTHAWYNAPSGTAGNAITFTQAMTLTASGRLLLGTTTEGTYLLDVNGTGRFTTGLNVNSTGTEMVNINNVDSSGRQGIRLNNGINASGGIVLFNSSSSTGTETGGLLRVHQTSSSLTQPTAVFRQDGTSDILQLQGSAGATRLTIASTGAATFSSSVTAGTPYVSFDSFNARGKIFLDDSTRRYVTLGMDSNVATINCDWYSGAGGDNPDFAIKTGGSERMRITSGGNLLVGTTTDSGEKLQVSGSSKLNGNTIIGSATTADVFSRGYSGRILGISASGQSAIELNSSTGNGAYFDMGVNGSRTFGIYSDTTNSDISTTGAYPLLLSTNSVPRLTIKTNGSINYTPMATPASAVAGDVYYDSTSNKLRCYNGTSWNDLF